MRHLRHLLDKPSQKSQENGIPNATTVELRLPTELIVEIINYISDRGDLACLCQVSKLLKAIAEPLLYGRIEINLAFDDYPLQPTTSDLCTHKMLTLYKGVMASQHASLVTDLRVHMSNWQICSFRRGRPLDTTTLTLSRCSCAVMDNRFGDVLALIHSLSVLHIRCNLCRANDRHFYLTRVKLRSLKSFHFSCSCGGHPFRTTEVIQTLPYMATITNLSIPWRDTPRHDSILKDDVLPNIKAISYDGSTFADSIVISRHILRICLMETLHYPSGLHHAISNSPGRLTHLYSVDILRGLSMHLSESPGPYRNLTSLGTFSFKSHEARTISNFQKTSFLTENQWCEVLDDLKPISRLTRLESIEVDILVRLHPPAGPFVCSIPEFRSALGDANPSLRRIFITARDAFIPGMKGTGLWSKIGPDDWKYQELPGFSYWDVVNGAYDNIRG